MTKRLENKQQIKRAAEQIITTMSPFIHQTAHNPWTSDKETKKEISKILKKEFGIYNELSTKCRLQIKGICTCSELKDPWDFGYDECPGWCPLCGKPWQHVRPGKSQPVCRCQE
jgi:hypothetical protein